MLWMLSSIKLDIFGTFWVVLRITFPPLKTKIDEHERTYLQPY